MKWHPGQEIKCPFHRQDLMTQLSPPRDAGYKNSESYLKCWQQSIKQCNNFSIAVVIVCACVHACAHARTLLLVNMVFTSVAMWSLGGTIMSNLNFLLPSFMHVLQFCRRIHHGFSLFVFLSSNKVNIFLLHILVIGETHCRFIPKGIFLLLFLSKCNLFLWHTWMFTFRVIFFKVIQKHLYNLRHWAAP